MVADFLGENKRQRWANREKAVGIINKYKHGNVDEVEQWLDDHPFLVEDGVVSGI